MWRQLASVAVVAGTLLTGAAVRASDDEAADIALWKSIEHSDKQSDFRGYLLLFPRGRFTPLARLRAGGTLEDTEGTIAGRLDVTPGTTLAGRPVMLTCTGFLAPALSDWIVVVVAGTPEFDPGARGPGQPLPLFAPTLGCGRTGVSLPPQPSGTYEVRYVSPAYNQTGRSETVARVSYFVS